jgi:hypothetical protein
MGACGDGQLHRLARRGTLMLYTSNGGCGPLDYKRVVESDASVTIDLGSTLPDADIEDGIRPGVTASESVELRKRNRQVEQENEILRRAVKAVFVPRRIITSS